MQTRGYADADADTDADAKIICPPTPPYGGGHNNLHYRIIMVKYGETFYRDAELNRNCSEVNKILKVAFGNKSHITDGTGSLGFIEILHMQ